MGVKLLDVLLYRSLLPVRESRREPLPVLELATGRRTRAEVSEDNKGPRQPESWGGVQNRQK